MKRLVRTRMLGVVGGVPGNRAPIPIALFCLRAWVDDPMSDLRFACIKHCRKFSNIVTGSFGHCFADAPNFAVAIHFQFPRSKVPVE